VKGLEAVAVAYLSKDPVLTKELQDGEDLHSNNQKALNLPNRLIAKTFLFRIIYGGGAYSFANDPEFASVGYNEKQWQEVIDQFYRKYSRLYQWHKEIVQEVIETRKLTVKSTGRIYEFAPINGKWPETQIKNFAVQGLGADIVALARVSLHNRLKRLREQEERWKQCLLVGTVHDSLVLDYNEKVCYTNEVANLIEGVFEDLPRNFNKMFGVEFNLDVRVEQEFGKCWASKYEKLPSGELVVKCEDGMEPVVIEKEK
jgi:DNA polymerase I-like protein with 3'-5' exonuclease and polymerase domains